MHRFLFLTFAAVFLFIPGHGFAEDGTSRRIDVPPPPAGDIAIGAEYGIKDALADYPWPDDKTKSLPWPEEFLGRWNANPRSGKSYLLIRQGEPIVLRSAVNDQTLQKIEYRIFRIQDGYVYAITRTTSYFEKTPTINYKYRRFYLEPSIIPDAPPTLRRSEKICGLSDLDWDRPPQIHWKRLTRATCNIEDSFSTFRNISSYEKE
ncbi:MAG: hypothetical protein HYU57_03140 [Micavibrio aeruginosavorus]|nr:hypothetical protein [Micavibrio aeruginosavorus]